MMVNFTTKLVSLFKLTQCLSASVSFQNPMTPSYTSWLIFLQESDCLAAKIQMKEDLSWSTCRQTLVSRLQVSPRSHSNQLNKQWVAGGAASAFRTFLFWVLPLGLHTVYMHNHFHQILLFVWLACFQLRFWFWTFFFYPSWVCRQEMSKDSACICWIFNPWLSLENLLMIATERFLSTSNPDMTISLTVLADGHRWDCKSKGPTESAN